MRRAVVSGPPRRQRLGPNAHPASSVGANNLSRRRKCSSDGDAKEIASGPRLAAKYHILPSRK